MGTNMGGSSGVLEPVGDLAVRRAPVQPAPAAPATAFDDFDDASDLFGEDAPESQRRSDGPLRVLFLSHYFPPEGNAPASRTYEMCKRWVRDGHDVTVVTCAPNNPTGIVYAGYKNRPYSVEHVDGIRVVRVWTFMAANKGKVR